MPGLQLLLFTVSELLREPPSPLPCQTLGLKDFTVLFYRSLDYGIFLHQDLKFMKLFIRQCKLNFQKKLKEYG